MALSRIRCAKNLSAILTHFNHAANAPTVMDVQGSKKVIESHHFCSTKSVKFHVSGICHYSETPRRLFLSNVLQIFSSGTARFSPQSLDGLSRMIRCYGTESKPEKIDGDPVKLSNREKLKRAVKDYGSTVIVFHVGISLVSLGCFYALVSSGIDISSLIQRIPGSSERLESVMTNSSTFVVAYAIHKIFAPIRISITLGATPFIVNYLRKIGILKIKIKKT